MRGSGTGGPDPLALLGLLAEEGRLRVVAALALGASQPSEVSAASGLEPRAVVRALNRLQAGGLVEPADGGLRLRSELFTEAARAAAPDRGEDHGAPDRETAAVLRAFLRDGRLVSIPAQRSKRRVVLDHIARIFEPGRRYPEPEVNAMLRAFHPDHAALRRYLVDEALLSREAGTTGARAGPTTSADPAL